MGSRISLHSLDPERRMAEKIRPWLTPHSSNHPWSHHLPDREMLGVSPSAWVFHDSELIDSTSSIHSTSLKIKVKGSLLGPRDKTRAALILKCSHLHRSCCLPDSVTDSSQQPMRHTHLRIHILNSLQMHKPKSFLIPVQDH